MIIKKINPNFFYYSIFILITFSLLKYYPKFTQYGYLDPNLYFGYIQNYSKLYNLYGLTYYSTRLAYIFPSIAFMKIFGLELGLLISSTLCIFLIQYVLFNFTKKNVSSFFVTLFITLFSTMLLRIGSWTSYELHAITYIFLMHYFLFSNIKYKYFFVGLFFYFASNCNLFFSSIVSISILSYFISQYKITKINIFFSKKTSINISLFFFGIISGLLLLTLIHYYLNGFTKFHFLEKAQFSISYQLMSGLSKNWFKDFETIFDSQIFFLYPFIYFYFLSVTVFFNRDLFQSKLFKYSFVFLFNLLIFAVLMHNLFDRPWFAWWFKIIYFTVPCFFATLSLLEAQNKNNDLYKYYPFVILIFIIFYFFNFYGIDFSFISLSTYKLLLLFVVLIYPIFHLSFLKNFKLFSTFIVIIITPIILLFSGSMYQIFKISNSYEKISDINRRNLELAHCMKYFQDSVVSNIDTNNEKRIKFLYPNNKPYLSSIQSTFLWGYSKVQVDVNNLSLDTNYIEKVEKFSSFFILSDTYDEFEIMKKDLLEKGFKNNTDNYECGSINNIYFSGFIK